MTTRADRIETAARAVHDSRTETRRMSDGYLSVFQGTDEEIAAAVLDAVLPQITTAEQLEALPIGTALLHPAGSVWTFGGEQYELEWRKMWRSISGAWVASAALIGDGPLTVAWQPQPEQETRADADERRVEVYDGPTGQVAIIDD